MSWIALSSAHIEARLAADELQIFEATGGGDGNRLASIIAQVTALVRAKVATCHKNTLGAAGTIPEECLHAASTIARHNLLSTLSSYVGADSDPRRDEYREANKFLDDVARCHIGITSEQSNTEVSSSTGCYGGGLLTVELDAA